MTTKEDIMNAINMLAEQTKMIAVHVDALKAAPLVRERVKSLAREIEKLVNALEKTDNMQHEYLTKMN